MNSLMDNAVDLSGIDPKTWRKDYIGDGYRYCCYRTVRNQETGTREGQIVLFGYDKSGNPTTFLCPHRSHVKYNVEYKTGERDIFGKYVATRYFQNSKIRHDYLENLNGAVKVVESLPPQSEFLHYMFDGVALEQSFNTQPLRIHYLDIETEIGDSFEKPKDARNRINMITVYDTFLGKYFTWSLDHAEVDFKEDPLKDMPKESFEFFEFAGNESRLLQNYLNWMERNYPDVICGFNSQAYDIPYLVRRIENVLSEEDASRMSPVGKYRIRENNMDNERANKDAEIIVDLDGVFCADELVLYRDKFKINQPLDGGNSLSNIGETEGLGRKIAYEGSLKDLYEKDYQKFYEYNVRDVDLLRRIEEKRRLIPLARQITSAGLSNYDSIYSSIGYLVGSLCMFSKTKAGGAVFQSYKEKNQKKLRYEGAFVFPPVVGFFKDGIAVVDYNSLYPSSIQAMNLSPETYVGKISRFPIEDPDSDFFRFEPPIDLDGTDTVGRETTDDEKAYNVRFADRYSGLESDKDLERFYILPANGKGQKIITRKQLDDLLGDKCIFTRNNTLFLKHSVKQGVVSMWCKHFYAERKATKKLMQKLELDLYNGKIPENEIPATKSRIENLDARQQAIKIMINSIYGIIGTAFSPIYNVFMAQSITRLGKTLNIMSSNFIKETFKTKYSVPNSYIICSSGDTDSQFVNIQCVTDNFRRENSLQKNIIDWPDEAKLRFWKLMDDFVENDVNGFVHETARRMCHTENPDVLRYSLEYIADREIMEGKKHYSCRKVLVEGPEIVDKIKYSGIELKKANTPIAAKKFLGEIYSGVLTKDWGEQELKKYLNTAYEEYRKLDITEISFWKGYGTEREAAGFLEMKKGTTGISKACTFYNQMIEHLGIGGRYDTLRPGNKARFCYIKPNNKYRINVIAFVDGQYPEEFRDLFEPDYDVMFEKMVLDPLKNFLVACGFSKTDPRNCNLMDVDDL